MKTEVNVKILIASENESEYEKQFNQIKDILEEIDGMEEMTIVEQRALGS